MKLLLIGGHSENITKSYYKIYVEKGGCYEEISMVKHKRTLRKNNRINNKSKRK